MKLIIAGSRGIEEINGDWLDAYVPLVTELVCGMAKGVDLAGKRWAEIRDIPVKEFPADWEKWGKAAGSIRNHEMALYADELLAFWDGKSRGTVDMIQQMIREKKPFQVILIRS